MRIKKIINKLIKPKKGKICIPCLYGNLLKGRKALITGGSSGIGFAIAENFLNNGASVTICGRETKKLEQAKINLINKCQCSKEEIEILAFDLNDISSMKEVLTRYLKNKKIDILVNNAGINGGDLFPNTLEKDFDRIIETNLKGMYFISQEFAKYMVNNKIQGNILNITSSSSLRPGISPYILSKWGERSLTIGLAKKYISYGITVNALAPGPTNTEMQLSKNDNDLYLDYSPSKRYLTTEEVGNLATILVSDIGKMIVGDTIYATGGSGLITYDDMTY